MTREVTVTVAKNTCNSSRDSFGSEVANGPRFCNVPHSAMADIAKADVTAPRLPKRNAAQRSGTRAKYSRPEGIFVRNKSQPTKSKTTTRAVASRTWEVLIGSNGWVTQSTSSEPTIKLPTASPSHQVSQMLKNSSHGANPSRLRLDTPTVAPKSVLRIPASKMNLRMFLVCSNALGPLAKRQTNPAPRIASKVLPAAILSAVMSDPAAKIFTAKAPRNIPGERR